MKRAPADAPTPRRERPDPPPAALGFRMPAEWEPHAATWIAWPHEPRDWPGKLPAIHWVYGEVVRHLAVGERVRILVVDRRRREARARGAPARRRRSQARAAVPGAAPTGAGRATTARSTSPTATARSPSPTGGSTAGRSTPNHKRDDAVNDRIVRRDRLRQWQPTAPIGRRIARVVLEGGAIDVNGAGTLLATEECLLDEVQARNPGLGREALETVLGEYLGVRKVLWLGRGIAGDDTHGHVDDLARFVDETTVVVAQESDPDDDNYEPLRENRARLERMTTADGRPLRVLSLPMPAPLFLDGIRLPASYANFYIGNEAVIVPTFNDRERSRRAGDAGRAVPDPAAWSASTPSIWCGASARSTA